LEDGRHRINQRPILISAASAVLRPDTG
jgi:hypothetical protein